ncbi:hypothetical protein GCK72_016205 [Caenorhabditis remanei]|uniref:Brix domain-containing protein n=1 Tax=Caenorhabditis remanei TaxID=31234 RepID=A0A6A5GW75_CAERE|nr:hypothetical protein GCK72_016205 [Caenorhabditis remanei]KAF1759738.1 hypothetical protein GCK72_016205 [Caenorhabditis remanei]
MFTLRTLRTMYTILRAALKMIFALKQYEVDSEYRWAGSQDPKIVITTSRDPSSRLKMFAKEMKLIFPNAQRINRGHYDVKQVVQACKAQDVRF